MSKDLYPTNLFYPSENLLNYSYFYNSLKAFQGMSSGDFSFLFYFFLFRLGYFNEFKN